jgi:hypothetical protein
VAEPGGRLERDEGTSPGDANAIWSRILIDAGNDITPDGPIATLTPTLQQLHAMFLVDGEVQNGGFNQLFFNGGGVWIPRAIEGFEAAGLPDHRQVVVDVIGPANAEQVVRDAARAVGTLQAFADTYAESDLGEFDDRWYQLSDVYEALDRFVASRTVDIWVDAVPG